MHNGLLEEWNIGIMGFCDRDCFHPSIGELFFHIIP
jgi:hypothetical protein